MKKDFFVLFGLIFVLILVAFVAHVIETPELETMELEPRDDGYQVTVNSTSPDGNEQQEFFVNSTEKNEVVDAISRRTGIFHVEIEEYMEEQDLIKN